MKNLILVMIAGIFVSGCSTVGGAMGLAGPAANVVVTKYCDVPGLARGEVRRVVGEAIHPNSIAVYCEGDDAQTVVNTVNTLVKFLPHPLRDLVERTPVNDEDSESSGSADDWGEGTEPCKLC